MRKDNLSYTITVIGGDYRHLLLYESFVEKGFSVSGIALTDSTNPCSHENSSILSTALLPSDIWIAGIPFTKDDKHIYAENSNYRITLEHFFHYLDKHPPKLLIAGHFSEVALNYARKYQIPCHDLLKCNSLAIANAIPTAEGAIYHAIKESPYVLHKAPCLIFGFGKCAKTLARKLKGLDAKVTICARKEDDLAYAENMGLKAISFDQLKEELPNYLFLFNTVPAFVLTEENLEYCSKQCTIIDLASMPGGIDFTAAKKLNLHVSHCLGLPGALSPKTATDILSKQICQLLFNNTLT